VARTKLEASDSLISRIVTAINWIIAFLLVLVLALVYWYAWRPLPQRSGIIGLPVSAPVSVTFDSLGEPHIKAASEEDALIAQGYVTAQDRLWQMDAVRRAAAGDLAEIVGAAAIENDREARRLGIRRAAEANYLTLPPQDRAALAAYTLGVNAFISTHLDDLPVEFSLLRYQPRPWSAVDSLLVDLQMFRTLTASWRDELAKRRMLMHGDPQKVEFLFAQRTGSEVQPGSNAWAIAGSRTASGKPMLSNDMHLDFSLPGIWYMTHLEAPGLNVAGVTLPGSPGIIVGHNQHIAWGFTNLGFDVQDLYLEQLDERTGRYLYRGQIERARPDVEFIRVKGKASEEMLVWITRHGPHFVTEGADHMTVRWEIADPSFLQYPVLEYDKAQNWQQFLTAMARFPGPSQNVVYADADGNIGYHAVGKLPIRHGFNGDVPVDGSKGEFEWDGYIPFDQLPSAFNPSRGMIVSANQNPFPTDYAYPVHGEFAPPARSREIFHLLSVHTGWQPGQMLSVQTDVYSEWLRFLASQVVIAYQKHGPRSPALDQAVDILRSWNGQMEKSLSAPFLISLVYQNVRAAVAESASPGNANVYGYSMAPGVIELLLRQRPAGWFRDYDEMLVRALTNAVEEGSRAQGSNLQRWQYGAWLRLDLNHPVVHQIPLVGRYFDIGPVAMSGSGTSIKQTTRVLGPSMRMTAETGNWTNSLLNIVTGESGQVLSRHYTDQWASYYAGRSFPMQFTHVDAKSSLIFQPLP
jgi:penicillin amidase